MKTNRSSAYTRRSGLTLGLALAVLPGLALAQTAVRDDGLPPARIDRAETVPLAKMDRDFLERAAKASMMEVQISQVAVARSSNPEVKRFAQRMIEDHGDASAQLAALASTRGISLPAKEPYPEKWQDRDAKDFDREYLAKMVSDHEDVVKLFQKHARDGKDPVVMEFARKHLPKMQEHLQQALDLKRVLDAKE